MRKERWRWSVILFLMLAGLFCPVKVHAEETDSYLAVSYTHLRAHET